MATTNNKLKCSFCGNEYTKEDRDSLKVIFVKSMLQDNNDIRICNTCITDCNNLVQEAMIAKNKKENKSKTAINKPNRLTPKQLKSKLDEWIIGQNKAKQDLAIAMYSHYKRINLTPDKIKDYTPKKSNVMLVGKSGTGKTSLIKALAKQLDIPVIFETANSFSNTGYIGKDVDDIVKRLIRETNGDITKAQKGIVVLDEIDKVRRISGNKIQSGQKDVNGEGVQQSILKLLEGDVVEIQPERNDMHGKVIKFDTTNVLFVLAGAFESIESIIQERLKKKNKESSFGFDAKITKKEDASKKFNELVSQLQQDDLVNFGMMPELMGRVPIVTALEELSVEALEQILTEPKDSIIKQFEELFRLDKVELEIKPKAIKVMAEEAKKKGTEARALRSIVESYLKEALYEVPETNIIKVVLEDDMKLTYVKDKNINNNKLSDLI